MSFNPSSNNFVPYPTYPAKAIFTPQTQLTTLSYGPFNFIRPPSHLILLVWTTRPRVLTITFVLDITQRPPIICPIQEHFLTNIVSNS